MRGSIFDDDTDKHNESISAPKIMEAVSVGCAMLETLALCRANVIGLLLGANFNAF